MIHIASDTEMGIVRIMDEVATLAHTKSLNVARRVRDALNAPRCVEGRTVARGASIGVIQATALEHGRFVCLVRVEGSLENWEATECEFVEESYPNMGDAEDAVPLYRAQGERDLYRKTLFSVAARLGEGLDQPTQIAKEIRAMLDRVDEGLLP